MRIFRLVLIVAMVLVGRLAVGVSAQQGQRQIDQETLREISRSLKEAGMPPEDIQRFLADIEGRPSPHPAEVLEEGQPVSVRRLAEDGTEFYLPLGNTLSIELADGEAVELPFTADGSGVLTVAAWAEPGEAAPPVLVSMKSGEVLLVDNDGRLSNTQGVTLVPIGLAGDYLVRIGGAGACKLTIAGEWLPFTGLQGAQAILLPKLDDATTVALLANTQTTAQLAADGVNACSAWARFVADEDGQLMVAAKAAKGDLALLLYEDGAFQNPAVYFDDDLEGNHGNELASFPVRAGQMYYIKVVLSGSESGAATLRTVLIPDEQQEEE